MARSSGGGLKKMSGVPVNSCGGLKKMGGGPGVVVLGLLKWAVESVESFGM
jgi:hypothetical protein